MIFFGKKKIIYIYFLNFDLLDFSKLLSLLLKVTQVITEHRSKEKHKQHKKTLFFYPKGKKSLDLRPKASAGALSKPV